MALFQAQPKNREVTVAALKAHLTGAERIPEEKIAVATGVQRELDGVDLFDPACPVEHVVTVEALKEGWDCSFAYVFCSVSRISSATDVEQLLGRVLRMPWARRRAAAGLNKAYAFVCEPSFGAAALALTDKLVKMGFSEEEARENVESQQGEPDAEDGRLFGESAKFAPVFRHEADLAAGADARRLAEALPEGATARATSDDKVEITVFGWVGDAFEAAVKRALPPPARDPFRAAANAFRRAEEHRFSPAERGEMFDIPALIVPVEGEFVLAETDRFLEESEWRIDDHPWRPDEDEFSIRETARGFEIDIKGATVRYEAVGEDRLLPLDAGVKGWTAEALVAWLDREVRQDDIDQRDLFA